MIADAKTWTELLSTIGIKLAYDEDKWIRLWSFDGKNNIGMNQGNNYGSYISAWASLEGLEESICGQCIGFVYVNDSDYGKHFIDNPWLSATSLDELKIRSDLNASNGQPRQKDRANA